MSECVRGAACCLYSTVTQYVKQLVKVYFYMFFHVSLSVPENKLKVNKNTIDRKDLFGHDRLQKNVESH